MTASPANTSEMDHLDQLGAKAFDGFMAQPGPDWPMPASRPLS